MRDTSQNTPSESACPPISKLARQSLFAMALARGATVRDAASSCEISEATAYRWAGDKGVADIANEYRRRIVRETIGKITAMGARATRRLGQLMESPDEAIALKASLAVLSEIQRVAIQTDDRVYRYAIEPPPIEPEQVNQSDGYSIDPSIFDGIRFDDRFDMPFPEPPGFGAKAADRHHHSQLCTTIASNNVARSKAKIDFDRHVKRVEAESEACTLDIAD